MLWQRVQGKENDPMVVLKYRYGNGINMVKLILVMSLANCESEEPRKGGQANADLLITVNLLFL